MVISGMPATAMMSPGPAESAGAALEGVGHQQLGDLDRLHRAVTAAPRDLLALADGAVVDAQQREAAQEVRGVEVGDVGLERGLGVVRGSRDRLDDRAEERLEVVAVGHAAVDGAGQRGPAGLRRRVHDGELELVLVVVGVDQEVHEQLVDLVDDLRDARVGPVDLVDAQHDRHLQCERLAQHEAGLRERALARVDEEDDAVDHRQAALDLATEVGVAGGVDDVDRHPARDAGLDGGLPGVAHGGVLREDRDALLALEVAAVHRPVGDVVVLAERPGLPQHLVDQGGLAVVDVGDDGDVTEVDAVGDRHKNQSLRYCAPVPIGVEGICRVRSACSQRVHIPPRQVGCRHRPARLVVPRARRTCWAVRSHLDNHSRHEGAAAAFAVMVTRNGGQGGPSRPVAGPA